MQTAHSAKHQQCLTQRSSSGDPALHSGAVSGLGKEDTGKKQTKSESRGDTETERQAGRHSESGGQDSQSGDGLVRQTWG